MGFCCVGGMGLAPEGALGQVGVDPEPGVWPAPGAWPPPLPASPDALSLSLLAAAVLLISPARLSLAQCSLCFPVSDTLLVSSLVLCLLPLHVCLCLSPTPPLALSPQALGTAPGVSGSLACGVRGAASA